MFVDHAGQTVGVTDRLTGETREAYVFVAVLGASNYTYAGATWTRGLRDWISSHAHQKYLEWTPSRIVEWAGTIGPFTAQLAERIMAERPHPEQGYRSCMGLIGLGRRYGKDRLEAAATRYPPPGP